jgi:hypothetical protein
MLLEAYQLAESVLSVMAKRPIKTLDEFDEEDSTAAGKGKRRKHVKKEESESQYEYMLTFDHSLGVKLLQLDYESTIRLNEMRMMLMKGFGSQSGNSSAPQSSNTVKSPSRTVRISDIHHNFRTRSVLPMQISRNESLTTKLIAKRSKKSGGRQLENLFEEKLIGRSLNFSVYEMCHQCKQIKPIASHLIKCNYSSLKFGTAIPSCININGVRLYNGMIYINKPKIVDVNSKYLKEYIEEVEQRSNKKQTMKCNRYYCKTCLRHSYDIETKEIQKQRNWICPFCQVNITRITFRGFAIAAAV